jgi:predicted ATP-dependent Lon-type protease
MNYKNLSLNKMADMLVKAMEQKEHFDKKAKQKDYVKKVQILKEVLTQEYKFAMLRNSNDRLVIEKHINYVKKLQNRESIQKEDQEIIDQLMHKYGV